MVVALFDGRAGDLPSACVALVCVFVCVGESAYHLTRFKLPPASFQRLEEGSVSASRFAGYLPVRYRSVSISKQDFYHCAPVCFSPSFVKGTPTTFTSEHTESDRTKVSVSVSLSPANHHDRQTGLSVAVTAPQPQTAYVSFTTSGRPLRWQPAQINLRRP